MSGACEVIARDWGLGRRGGAREVDEALVRLRRGRSPEPQASQPRRDELALIGPYMNVDAAYAPDTGLAGIAYVGSMGESSRVVVCDSSVEAELRAMVMAMDAASERGLERITFRTDCQSVGHPYGRRGGPKVMDLRQQIRDHLGAHLSWRLTQVPRRANAAANAHARKALRRAQGWPR